MHQRYTYCNSGITCNTLHVKYAEFLVKLQNIDLWKNLDKWKFPEHLRMGQELGMRKYVDDFGNPAGDIVGIRDLPPRGIANRFKQQNLNGYRIGFPPLWIIRASLPKLWKNATTRQMAEHFRRNENARQTEVVVVEEESGSDEQV